MVSIKKCQYNHYHIIPKTLVSPVTLKYRKDHI